MDRVVPEALFEPPRNSSQWFVEAVGASRSVLYKGNVTQGDVFEILPFGNPFFAVRAVAGAALAAAFAVLNAGHEPAAYVSTDPDPLPGKLYVQVFAMRLGFALPTRPQIRLPTPPRIIGDGTRTRSGFPILIEGLMLEHTVVRRLFWAMMPTTSC